MNKTVEKIEKLINRQNDFVTSINEGRMETDNKYAKWNGVKKNSYNIRNYMEHYYNVMEILNKHIPHLARDFQRYYDSNFDKSEITNDSALVRKGFDIKFQLNSGWTTGDDIYKSLVINNTRKYLLNQLAILERAKIEINRLGKVEVNGKYLVEDSKNTAKWLIKQKMYRASGILSSVMMERIIVEKSDALNFKTDKKSPSFNDRIVFLKTKGVLNMTQFKKIDAYYSIRNHIIAHPGEEVKVIDAKEILSGLEFVERIFTVS